MAIDYAGVIWLISPAGEAYFNQLAADASETRGADVLEWFKETYPDFTEFIDLVANYDAETAYQKLADKYSHFPLWLFKELLKARHQQIAAIINGTKKEKPNALLELD